MAHTNIEGASFEAELIGNSMTWCMVVKTDVVLNPESSSYNPAAVDSVWQAAAAHAAKVAPNVTRIVLRSSHTEQI